MSNPFSEALKASKAKGSKAAPATAPADVPVYNGVKFLLSCITQALAYELAVLTAFVETPALFAGRTEKQLQRLKEGVATAARNGGKLHWVHQTFRALPHPDSAKFPPRLSLRELWDRAVLAGMIEGASVEGAADQKEALTALWIAVCDAAKQAGHIEQRMVKGGYQLALKADLPAYAPKAKTAKPMSAADIRAQAGL